ncbi:hypothetical protein HDU93_009517 [Gonapodya sp. JEL0774]|nr:hypothetical protein HDU93_009517 [Gonapodya sp. JEL0774]
MSKAEDQLDPVFYALPQIVSAFPSLRSLTLLAIMDWVHVAKIEESGIWAPEAAYQLCDPHFRTFGLLKNPSASLGVHQVKLAERASIIKKFGQMLHQMLGGRGRGKRGVVVLDR